MTAGAATSRTDGADGGVVRALEDVRTAVGMLRLDLPSPGADDAAALRAELLARIDDHLLPRARSADAPMLVVVGGSTGAGKSTIVNSLVGAPVSPSGVLRPTTLAPVLAHHPQDAPWFADDRVLPGLSRAGAQDPVPADSVHRTLRLVPTTAVGPGYALLDAPDVDSVVAENRDLAAQLLAAADLWLFVTTAARYADAVPWDLLDAAAQRRTQVALVLNRVDAHARAAITEHLEGMLAERGHPDARVFPVDETTLVSGMLGPEPLGPLRAWLAAVTEPDERHRVVAATFDGAVDDLGHRLVDLAVAAREQVAARDRLAAALRREQDAAATQVARATADGAMLRGEVLARWQDFVGTGDFLRRVEQGVGRARDRVTAFFRGRTADAPAVARAVGHDLEAVILDAVHGAAERTYDAWRADPAGRDLADGLARGGPHVREHVAEQVRAWQGDVLELVSTQGQSKRGRARALSFGVNGLGVALMVVVFASTGALTGAEVGIAGGTAVLAQRLLEAVFGDDAVRRLAVTARERLDERVRAVLEADGARFQARLDAKHVDDGAAEQIERARDALARARSGDGEVR